VQTSQEIKIAWENSLSARAANIHIATHGHFDNKKISEYSDALNFYEDALINSGVQRLERLTGASIEAAEIGRLFEGLDSGSAKSDQSLILCIDRMSLASSLYNAEISLGDYQKSVGLVLGRENDYVLQNLADFEATENASNGQKEIETKLAALQEQVARLSTTGKVPYPPEFWIAIAAAICSWMVTLYNLIFSFLKEKRERRKEEREVARVLVYSESDLQTVLTASHLSQRRRR